MLRHCRRPHLQRKHDVGDFDWNASCQCPSADENQLIEVSRVFGDPNVPGDMAETNYSALSTIKELN